MTSFIFLAAILGLVIYLSVTKVDQTPPEVVEAEMEETEEAEAVSV